MLDELDRVRAHRADFAEPDAAAIAYARETLIAAMSAEPERKSVAANVRRRSRHPRLRWSRKRSLKLALAAGIGAIAIAIAGSAGFSSGTSPSPALAGALEHLAQVAASQSWGGVPKHGQWLYTESVTWQESGGYANYPGTHLADTNRPCLIAFLDRQRVWEGADASGASYDIRYGARLASEPGVTLAQSRANCAAIKLTPKSWDGFARERFPKPKSGYTDPFILRNWHTLSTDPKMLLRQVYNLESRPGANLDPAKDPEESFVSVGDMMRYTLAPPIIRAALFRAAELIPNVELLGVITDPLGGRGLAIAYPYSNGQRDMVLIFNQRTGRLAAEEDYDSNGRRSYWVVYLKSKIVDELPNYPVATN